uniref:Uncharacterized protein n=1 Tax=Oryzias sinensis TaxID=183150 RepID=A0A8C7XL86_9TELE
VSPLQEKKASRAGLLLVFQKFFPICCRLPGSGVFSQKGASIAGWLENMQDTDPRGLRASHILYSVIESSISLLVFCCFDLC